MFVKFVSLEHALGRIMQQIMSETLTASTTPERMAELELVRAALLEAWPEQIKDAGRRTDFLPNEQGNVTAMFAEIEQN